MGFKLFGFQIGRSGDELKKLAEKIPSFVAPENYDGAIELPVGGSTGLSINLDALAKTEVDLINKYRDLSLQPEVETVVDDIVNEAIVVDKDAEAVGINLEDVNQPDEIKAAIEEEFCTVLKLLNFQNLSHDIFRRWYIDGRMYYHIMIDTARPRDGIKELRFVDPRRMRKVREPIMDAPTQIVTPNHPEDAAQPAYQEYYYYKPQLLPNPAEQGMVQHGELRVAADSVCYVHSGLLDQRNQLVLSYLHKAIKPMNQLRTMEDAVVIYRLARAPERRVFYVDVGNLPKMKAEQYLQEVMTRNKNRLVYDAQSGEIRDDRKFMTMLEDYYLARRGEGKGTEITHLQGGQNLGEMTDVEYFRKRLYKSLNVPISRIESEGQFNLGRASEITRDELKFAKFIQRLRHRFTHLFDNLLEIQLSLKGIMRREDWRQMRNEIKYDFLEDNFFSESKTSEIMGSRLDTLSKIEGSVGKYYSRAWVRRHILQMTEDEVDLMEQEIEEEKAQEKEEQAAQGLANLGLGPDGTPLPVDPNAPPVPGQVPGQPAQPGQAPQAAAAGPVDPKQAKKKKFPFKKRAGTGTRHDGDTPFKNNETSDESTMTDAEKLLIENMTKAVAEASKFVQEDEL